MSFSSTLAPFAAGEPPPSSSKVLPYSVGSAADSPGGSSASLLPSHPFDLCGRAVLLAVDDIAKATVAVLDTIPTSEVSFDLQHPTPASSYAPFRVYNVGNERPVKLLHFIETLEKALGREAVKEFLPMQPGDIEVTRADVSALRAVVGFAPSTPIEEGIPQWVDWYRSYHQL